MRNTNLRGSRSGSRAFCTILLLLSLLTAYSFLAETQHPRASNHHGNLDSSSQVLRRRDEPSCREVHKAADQCAFIKQYCLDEDSGLLPYLQLYYCTLGRAKPLAFIILALWLGLLFSTIGIAASDFFSVNLSTIATILGLSESLAGVTFLAFGNGSPDVFSTFAAMSSNSASMALGELIGAACFIVGVVAGSMALVREFRVDRRTYARDICFFIVAVAFTMVFLADGQLRFWECCVMIGYYVVYVVTVVGLHWHAQRKKHRLHREEEARSHVFGIVGQSRDELVGGSYHDDPDSAGSRENGANPHSRDGPRIELDGHEIETDWDAEEDEEDAEWLVAAEVTSSMRVLRTGARRGRVPKTPIRPSLVGALEFRSALAQLQRESNLQLSSISHRSQSMDHLQNRGRRRTTGAMLNSAPPQIRHAASDVGDSTAARDRALSTGNAPASSNFLPDFSRPGKGSDLLLSTEPNGGQQTQGPAPSQTLQEGTGPASLVEPGRPIGSQVTPQSQGQGSVPSLHLRIPSRQSSYGVPSSPASPFPRYTDSPMMQTPNQHSEGTEFPLPASTRRGSFFADLLTPADQPRPVSWWPYAVLPSPHVLFATMFPTLQGWREKSHWDRFISAISVPSIFLLVITLPVVESETTEDVSDDGTIIGARGPADFGHVAPPISVEPGAIEHESEWERYRRHSFRRSHSHQSSHLDLPDLLTLEHEETAVESPAGATANGLPTTGKPVSDEPLSVSNVDDETASWNRWLVCVQLFTGPLFAVFILWANISDDWENPGKVLVRMMLYTLTGSLVLLGLLIFLTSERKRPRYHFLLCFMGFVISIAWISTIAEEVVGVLKMFGVVLGISEGLLGLTIFAAGNSVGDLIADITIARLGYPVMALSACFGGPMLNILLGIGIGGVVMMVQKANSSHKKHPDQPRQYGPYRVQVGGTLMISAITLLIILVGLLIVVPLNKWMLSRKIGWGLIGMWTVSTIVNVIVELTGAWGEV